MTKKSLHNEENEKKKSFKIQFKCATFLEIQEIKKEKKTTKLMTLKPIIILINCQVKNNYKNN